MTACTDTPEGIALPRPDWQIPEKPEATCHECGGELLPRIDDSDDEGYALYWDCQCGHIGEHGWLIDWPFADGQPGHYRDLYALGFQPLD